MMDCYIPANCGFAVDFTLEKSYGSKELHGPSMFTVKAKIHGVLYKQSSSIAFDETSCYWLAPKNS